MWRCFDVLFEAWVDTSWQVVWHCKPIDPSRSWSAQANWHSRAAHPRSGSMHDPHFLQHWLFLYDTEIWIPVSSSSFWGWSDQDQSIDLGLGLHEPIGILDMCTQKGAPQCISIQVTQPKMLGASQFETNRMLADNIQSVKAVQFQSFVCSYR